MAFFKKLKKDMGVEEDVKVKPEAKESTKTKDKAKKEEKPVKKEPEREKDEKENEEEKEEKKDKGSVFSGKKSSDWLKAKGQLAVDVYETETDFYVQAPIAGVGQEDIDISVENEMLIIKGERKEPDKDPEKHHFYQECYWGPFSRQIILPEDVDVQKIKASLKVGILTVKIPRLKAQKKKVTIEIEG